MGAMNVLDRTGDVKIIWNPNNPAEVENAKRTFSDLRAKGYLAYRVQAGGEKGEVMREFDATAEKIILAPPLAGG